MSLSAKSVLKTACAVLVLASVAACAEKPKPVAMTPPPPTQAEVPPPPRSEPPVQQNNLPGIQPGSQQDFVVNVGDRVYFDTDHSDIRADAQGILSAQAAWLVRYPAVKVRIEAMPTSAAPANTISPWARAVPRR
jgi:peptidoglycan-associated lipoprotein